jgi:protein O-GlcNAc transferase
MPKTRNQEDRKRTQGERLLASAYRAFGAQEYRLAARFCLEARRLIPKDAEVCNLLACTFLKQKSPQEAKVWLYKALHIDPDHVDALVNLGNCLREEGDLEGSRVHLQHAVDLAPQFSMAVQNLFATLIWQHRFREAAMLALAAHAQGVFDEALMNPWLLFALRADAVWDVDIDAITRQMAYHWRAGDKVHGGYTMLSTAVWDDPSLHQIVSRLHSRELLEKDASQPLKVLPAPRREMRPDHRPLRLGYLSSGFKEHPTGSLIDGVFALHDRRQFEVYGYFASPEEKSAVGQRLRAGCDHIREVARLSHRDTADLIRRDGIDLLICCGGHTEGTPLPVLAMRPAPVQIHYLDYAGPLCFPELDYAIFDQYVVPPGAEIHFDEAVLALPHSYHVCAPQAPPHQGATRKELGWPENAVVMGDWARSYRMSPEMFASRMRIVEQAPESILVLLASTPAYEESLRQHWAANGLSQDRLLFAPAVSPETHHSRTPQVDLLLSPFPGGIAANAIDALRQGIPVLGIEGQSVASRNLASILQTHGIPELISSTFAEFEQKAIFYANHPVKLQALKTRLRGLVATSPLFDQRTHVRALEKGLLAAWERYSQGKAPGRIDISPG